MAAESVGSSPGPPPQTPFRKQLSISPNTPNKSIVCYSCGQDGHYSTFCPNKSSGSSPNKANCPRKYPEWLCNSCGQPCVARTSNTPKNPGREYYTCSAFIAKSPEKPIQRLGAAVSQNPMCPCKAGPSRVETRQHGQWKGRKYFACCLKAGQGQCINVRWCDGGEDDEEMIRFKMGVQYDTVTEELQNTTMNTHRENGPEEIIVPTFSPQPSPTTPRAVNETNCEGLGSSAKKSPSSLSKPKQSQHVASLSVEHYHLNEEPMSPDISRGTINDQGTMHPVETSVTKLPPQRRRVQASNDAWLESSSMRTSSLTEDGQKDIKKCIICGEIRLLETCDMCDSCNLAVLLII